MKIANYNRQVKDYVEIIKNAKNVKEDLIDFISEKVNDYKIVQNKLKMSPRKKGILYHDYINNYSSSISSIKNSSKDLNKYYNSLISLPDSTRSKSVHPNLLNKYKNQTEISETSIALPLINNKILDHEEKDGKIYFSEFLNIHNRINVDKKLALKNSDNKKENLTENDIYIVKNVKTNRKKLREHSMKRVSAKFSIKCDDVYDYKNKYEAYINSDYAKNHPLKINTLMKNFYRSLEPYYKLHQEQWKSTFNKLFSNNKELIKLKSFDQQIKDFKFVTFNSLKVYLSLKIPPKFINDIFHYLNVTKIRSDIEFSILVNRIIDLSIEEVFKICFYVFNPNHIGDIDNNDLMILYHNYYSKSECLQYDVDRLIHLMHKKSTKDNYNTLQNLNFIKKIIEEDYKHTKPSNKYIQDNDNIIDNIMDRNINNDFEKDIHISYEKYLFNIDWTTNYLGKSLDTFYPNLWKVFMNHLCGNKDKLYSMINTKTKQKEFSKKSMSSSLGVHLTARRAYQIFFEMKEIYGYKYDLLEYLTPIKENFESKYYVYNTLESSFKSMMAINSNIVNLDSLKLHLETVSEMTNINKLANVVYSILSPHKDQCCFFRFLVAIYKILKEPLATLFSLLDMNGGGSIGNYELEYWFGLFRFSPYIKAELMYLEECMNKYGEMGLYELKQGYKDEKYCYSRITNTVVLMIYGCKYWKEYTMDPDSISDIIPTFEKKFPGFKCPQQPDWQDF